LACLFVCLLLIDGRTMMQELIEVISAHLNNKNSSTKYQSLNNHIYLWNVSNEELFNDVLKQYFVATYQNEYFETTFRSLLVWSIWFVRGWCKVLVQFLDVHFNNNYVIVITFCSISQWNMQILHSCFFQRRMMQRTN